MSPAAAPIPVADPTELAVHAPDAQRMGFFTDTTVCIGCKACQVACKQWNDLPGSEGELRRGKSYDMTGSLSATTWRHVRFVEAMAPSPAMRAEAQAALDRGVGGFIPEIPAAARGESVSMPTIDELRGAGSGVAQEEVPDLVAMAEAGNGHAGPTDLLTGVAEGDVDIAQAVADFDRWIFMSDVCKHCTNAGCLDACPTGALIRTEFETVFLQPDVCNGCGYCVPACPFGVVDRDHDDGRAAKCTLCYDRLQDGLEPACAKACPTDSIQFGVYTELVEKAERRVVELHERGVDRAYLYGAGDAPGEQIAGGLGAFFLLTDPPERFGLPAQADSPVQENVVPATLAAMGAGLAAAAGVAAAFVIGRARPATKARWRLGAARDAAAWGPAVARRSLTATVVGALRR